MLIKLSPREAIPQETLSQFYKPLSKTTMSSIWDAMPVDANDKDYSNSKFLDKRLISEKTMTLKFTNLLEKEQRPETPDNYKTDSGTTFMFYFQDNTGKEFELEQKNAKGLFYKAMQEQKIDIGEVVTITREGTGTSTKWTVTRTGATEAPRANPLF